MAVRRSTIKLAVGPALYNVMEPGDQIIAGTWAMAGPGPWLDLLGAVVGVAGVALAAGLAAIKTGAGLGALMAVAPTLVSAVMQFRRWPVFMAVTQRQLICYRLSRTKNAPARLLFCAPPVTVRMTRLRRTMPGSKPIRYDGPGAEGRSLQLNVAWPWRRDLDEVLAALQAQGASVAGPPSAPTPLPGETFPQ